MILSILKIQIVVITEINPKNKLFEVSDAFFYISGYTHLEKRKRGVIIYVKNCIIHRILNMNSEEIEMVWIKITLYQQDSLLFGCINRSPNSSLKTSLELKNIIEKANNSGCSHL